MKINSCFFFRRTLSKHCRGHCFQWEIHFWEGLPNYYWSLCCGFVTRGRCCDDRGARRPRLRPGRVGSILPSCVFSASFAGFETRSSLVSRWVAVHPRFQSCGLESGTCWSGTPSPTLSTAWSWSWCGPCCWCRRDWVDLRSLRRFQA